MVTHDLKQRTLLNKHKFIAGADYLYSPQIIV